jgi:hypothetical protein
MRIKKLLAVAGVSALSVIGSVGIMLSSASANPTPTPQNLPPDQIVLVGACFSFDQLHDADMQAVHNYQLNGPPAGVWLERGNMGGNNWQPAAEFPNNFNVFICVIVTPPFVPGAPGVPTPPIVTTTTTPVVTPPIVTTTTVPVATTLPAENPCTGMSDCTIVCDHDTVGTDDCNICIGNGSCDVIECPVQFTVNSSGECIPIVTPPIVTTTTIPVATTLPATPPVTHCVIVRRVQICTIPPTTVAPTTSTTVAPTTTIAPTTTVPVATTLPVVPTTEANPCQGINDCHVVCNHDSVGTDDCQICIGNEDCNAVPAPPIVTTTTVAPETTTTVHVTPVSVSVPHHPYG